MSEKLFNLCLVAAAQIVSVVKQQYPSCSSAQACADPPAPSANESTEQMLDALKANLPGIMEVIGANVAPLERKLFESQAALSPEQAKLDQNIQAANALSQATAENAVLTGPGGQLVRNTSALNAELDPEFFKTREALGKSSVDLLGSLDFGNTLSGSERSEVERSLNRDNLASGTMDTPSAIQTISNALSFGKAGEARKTQRQATATNAIGTVGAVNPGTRQGIDPLQTAVGRNSSPGVNTQIGQSALGLGSNVLGQIGANQQQANEINANRRDLGDRAAQAMDSISC